MLSTFFPVKQPTPRTVLCLGAHCDDIEIGCGGTILTLLENAPDTEIWWIVFSSDKRRDAEARESASRFLARASRSHVRVEQFRNGYFPFVGDLIKDYLEERKQEMRPDIIFTHYRHDRHQDHRTISDLTWNTFRDNVILEYEIPKYDGDVGQPNSFVPISIAIRDRKISHIMECFKSQQQRAWFSNETFLALMRLRGIECNSPSGYAEAFHARKLTIDFGSRPGEKTRE